MHKRSQAIALRSSYEWCPDGESAAASSASPHLQFKLDIDDNDNAFFDAEIEIQMLVHDADDEQGGWEQLHCLRPSEHDTIAALRYTVVQKTKQRYVQLVQTNWN